MYAVDGKFKEYPGDFQPLSTDGSREFLKSFSNITIIDRPDSYEIDKRNAYLEAAGKDDMDVLLVIDADEYIQSINWAQFFTACHVQMSRPGLYKVRGFDNGTFDPWPRLVHPPKDFEYHILHYGFRYKPSGYFNNASTFARTEIKGVKIMHDEAHRTPEQLQSARSYQMWLRDYEERKLEDFRAEAEKLQEQEA